MPEDIRLHFGFFDHPKTIKLERRLGWAGVISLERLWMFAAQHRPKGELGSNVEDIEIAARWQGDGGKLVQVLLETGWLDQNDNGYTLHDWKQHQGWIYHAPERSEKARENINKRWAKVPSRKSPKQHDKIPLVYESYTEANTPSPSPSPSPSPYPSPYPSPSLPPKKQDAQSVQKKDEEKNEIHLTSDKVHRLVEKLTKQLTSPTTTQKRK